MTDQSTRVVSAAPAESVKAPVRSLGWRALFAHRLARVLLFLSLGALAVVMFYPFFWMVATSLRKSNTVFTGPLIPTKISLSAYGAAWDQINFGQHFLNSAIITGATVIGVLLLSTVAGYAFAKLNFAFKQTIFICLLSTMMMPATALIIPLYLQLKSLGLLNSQGGLILCYVGTSTPFAMFLMRAFFETLPDELLQAARIDGASEFTIFRRVMLPLARPGIATVVVFQFLASWNEFLYANTMISDPDKAPLQPILFSLLGQYSTNWPVLTAGLTMSVLPIIAVYVRMQKQFTAGMTLGAVKE